MPTVISHLLSCFSLCEQRNTRDVLAKFLLWRESMHTKLGPSCSVELCEHSPVELQHHLRQLKPWGLPGPRESESRAETAPPTLTFPKNAFSAPIRAGDTCLLPPYSKHQFLPPRGRRL